jgi:hypothetical protein
MDWSGIEPGRQWPTAWAVALAWIYVREREQGAEKNMLG